MRIVLRVLVVLLLIALLGWFGGRAYLARSVAKQEGTIAIGGVHADDPPSTGAQTHSP